MKAILIDDEPLALQSMARMLERSGVSVVAAFGDPAEALRKAPVLEADVAFLDMEMPGLSGLETAERLQGLLPSLQIVFVTAYDQYAIDAFELEAVDYLLKPVQPRRLEKTLERLKDRLSKQSQAPAGDAASAAAQAVPMLCCLQHLSYVTAGGAAVEVPWRTLKAKELFAYLIHTRESGVNKETLTDMLWPDLDAEKAQTNLHTAVYQIRRTVKTLDMPIVIAYLEGVYRIAWDNMEIDSERWEREAGQLLAEAASGGAPDSGRLQLVLQSYRGDYLEHEGYLWAEGERQRLRVRWLECARLAADRYEEAGATSELIGVLHRIRSRFPLMDDVYFRLMRLYDRLGQPAEVRSEYERLAETMQSELGMEPDGGIVAWYAEWQRGTSRR